MSTGVEKELTAAFESASEFVRPHPELAGRARAGARKRRRRTIAGAAAASAAVIAIAATTYAAAGHHQGPATVQHRPGDTRRILATVDYQVTQLAISGQYLYVLAGQNSMLTAYDRATGKLVRQLNLPSPPSALAVGPGGLVWLAFYPSNQGGPTAVWLLSPDLRLHSAYAGIVATTILPDTRTSAWVPDQYGVVRVLLPAPGQPGRASQRLEPGSSLGPSQNTAPGAWVGLLAGRIVVQVTNGYGYDSHLVIAGLPGRTFGGSRRRHQVGAVTSTGNSLWAELFAIKDNYAAQSGPLVRLDSRLRATTPTSIQASAVLAKTANVWSSGDTVWAATSARGHALVCFSAAGSHAGPVITVQATGSVAALAATASTAYVTTVQGGGDGPSVVTSYPVPRPCR